MPPDEIIDHIDQLSLFPMDASSAKFIVVDGIDGAGKSSHIQTISDFFKARNEEVHHTREPGGTQLGETLRPLMLGTKMAPETEALLMFAARNEHLIAVIKPTLEQGIHVICDRFTEATYAYQGAGHGVDEYRIHQLEQWIQAGFFPDLTLIFDVAPEVAQARLAQTEVHDCFESESLAFFERVRVAYLHRAATDPGRYEVIDGSQPIDEVQQQVLEILNRRFG